MLCLAEKINQVALCLPCPDGMSTFCDKRGCLAQIVLLRHDNNHCFLRLTLQLLRELI